MSSRLDRLFLLLENGGSDATRQAAAFQLGEVVRLHPHELETLLDRLHAFITSKSWETRIAASQAVDAIIKNIAIWDPHPIKGSEDAELGTKSGSEVLGHLSLESFSIMRVLEKGSYLLGADETQFELDEEDGKLDPKERAARQRLLVNQRLGFDIAEAIGINTHNIFSNSDLTDHVPEDENKPMRSKDSVVQIVQEEMASAGLRMSSRELNRAKRKAKFLSKQKSNDPTDKTSDEGPEKKRLKLNHGDDAESDDDENNLTIADDRMFQEQEGEWPLEEFAEHLSRDLFSSSWETRHGAATALRQVIRLQGHGAGRSIYQTAAQMKVSHLSWLEDKAVRLVCVLALDRFGDFLADQVVAPVRETCAQVLGCIVQHVPERIVLTILSLLQEMLLWRDWGTRHGGLLGLKYLLAVRSDMRKELLAKAYDHIYEGLRDEMDDVVAVAATCLVPVAEDLVKCLPSHTINELVATLWEALLDIDDLTASTSSILLLISKLLSYPKILNTFDGDLSQLIPRLWPFLYHSSCSIRTSTLKAIETLLENLSVNRIPLRENSPPVETEREKNHSNQESKTPKIKLENETKMEIEKSEPNETLKVEEETVHPNGSNGVKLGEMNANSETKLGEMNANSETKLGEMNANSETKLEEVNTNSETKLEEVNTNSETKLEEVNTNSETKLEEMTTNSETKLEEMTTRSETKLKAMTTRSETKLKAMNTRSKTKLEAMNTRSETKLEAMNTRSETKLEAMSTDSETKLGAMSTDSETKLEAMSTDSETKLGAMSTDSETKLGAMSTDSETKLGAMSTDSETKLGAMSTDSETKLGAMSTDSETKLGAMSTDSETKLEAMSTDSETKLGAMSTDSETKLEAMNTDSETKLEAMNTDSETKLGAMNTDSETKLGAMNTDSETKLEAMNTDSETKLEAMNTDSETKLGAMNTDSETKLGAMNTDSETKLGAMNTDSETKLEEMNSDSETKMEDNEEKVTTWLENILEPLLIHIYQRGLLENSKENMELIEKIWNLILRNVSLSNLLMVVCRLVSSWLCLMMTGTRIPLDPSLLVLAYHSKSGDGLKKTPRLSELGECVNKLESKYFIGGPKDSMDDRAYEDQVIMARCTVAKLLGNLSHYVTQPMPSVEYQPDQTPILCYVRLLIAHLNSRSAIQRYGAGLVVREWAIQHPHTLCHSLLKESLLNCVMETIYFDEIAWMFTRLQQEAKDFLAMLKHYKIPVDPSFSSVPLLTLEQIQYLCESNSLSAVKLRKNIAETLESRSKSILKNVTQTSTDQIKLSIAVQSVIAGALVRFQFLPEKLNPVIKPLMESVKKETSEQQQKMASSDLTFLLELCIDRQPSPNAKVVKNLASFLCVDEDFTPNIVNSTSRDLIGGILSLSMQQKSANAKLCRRTSSSGGRGPGRPPLKSIPSTSSENSSDVVFESPQDIVIKKQNAVQRRGCTLALVSIVNHLGAELGKKLPHLLNMLFEPLENPPTKELNVEVAQNIINWLQLLETIIPVLHNDLLKKFESLLKVFDLWLYHLYPSVRHMAGRVYAALAAVSTTTVVCSMIENVLPNLGLVGSTEHRMGALECVHLTIEKLGFQIVPYIVLLIVPLLGSMSDPEETVRHLGTQCFATLIRLFPLDGGTALPPNISPKLVSQIAKERVFVDRLLDPRKIENYKIPVPINAELRSYQQKGVNWLAFLNEYNLHGVLCDDMGLGKTLQSICILAGDHYEKETLYKKSKEKPAHAPCHRGYQSLVVCPPTLTGHWYYEVIKFVSKEYLDPLHYTGPPIERRRLRNYFEDHNLIIASYKIVRNEVDFFSKIKWNYIILDEGHTIKNGKTKSSKAIKELVGKHRLILTGTPIQNNVLELWSLFDFLMPGFLGTEKQFMAKYSRPIIQSKEAKSSTKEQEAGVLALEALHRQVLPFLLRRVKEDVLKDLPPKITQDYYCDLSPLQERLYEDFARSRACQTIDETLSSEEKVKPQTHIFQALQYLRRVCNHPKLALLPSHPQYEAISKQIRESKTPLSDIAHAAKLPALKQLLLDCGIGSSDETNPSITPSAVVSPHRALIFCQLKGMLDIIEQDLLKAHLSTVTYLRLDGSVPAGSRHSLVQRFNSDPSIDLLLLTTQVGGLGLNLTGADTVIFVEHDWNPMRDLQAMDRAHRIGQKRVVNVYRLITKGTLEEKIMSLQKFKLMTANSVISQENSSLLSMGTDQLLELFTLDTKSSLDSQNRETSSNGNETQTLGLKGPGIKGAIENLPALWEEGLYDEEYNLDSFLKSLK